jgi:hypothetical protein
LILSEFAGAAQSLAGSLIINPCKSHFLPIGTAADDTGDCQQTADSILSALTLSAEQRASNWGKLWNVSHLPHMEAKLTDISTSANTPRKHGVLRSSMNVSLYCHLKRPKLISSDQSIWPPTCWTHYSRPQEIWEYQPSFQSSINGKEAKPRAWHEQHQGR